MELKPHFDLLIPGNYFCDIIFTGLPHFPVLGEEIYAKDVAVVPGGVMNTVIALRRLGVRVGWIGAIGSDFFSEFALAQALAEGVDLSLMRRTSESVRHVTVALSFPTDRTFVAYTDEGMNVVDLALEGLERASFSHLHFPGLTVEERVPGLIERCHERGIMVSMDCQHRDETLAIPLVREVLGRVDIFMPNAAEAQKISRTNSLDEAVSALTEIVSYLVIKDGANGAAAFHNGEQFREPALSVSAVDTTGAGDVFNAGFLAAHLCGLDTHQCLRWGNYCGGMSTRGAGAVHSPTLEDLQTGLVQK